MTVGCEIDYVELDGYHATIESVCARCSRCGHETESYGTSDASIRRCLLLLREECPRDETNCYVDEHDAA